MEPLGTAPINMAAPRIENSPSFVNGAQKPQVSDAVFSSSQQDCTNVRLKISRVLIEKKRVYFDNLEGLGLINQ